MIDIEQVDHIGIRVIDEKRTVAFYAALGFDVMHRIEDVDAVTILRNRNGVEVNLIRNGVLPNHGPNVLMDVPEKYPGYTHVALRVSSIPDTLRELRTHQIQITQGPVTFGDGHVSIFVRDPDANVIELRGRMQPEDEIEGLQVYSPD